MNPTTLEIDWELPLTVTLDYDPGEPEIRYYSGKSGCCPNGDGHPGLPPDVNLISVTVFGAEIVDKLPDILRRDIEEWCLERMAEDADNSADYYDRGED